MLGIAIFFLALLPSATQESAGSNFLFEESFADEVENSAFINFLLG